MSLQSHMQRTVTSAGVTMAAYSHLLQRKCRCGGTDGPTGECTACRRKHLLSKPPQTKLTVNRPGDRYEQEADRVAAQITRTREPSLQYQTNGGEENAGQIPPVQRHVTGGESASEAPPIVYEVLRSLGRPLDPATQELMESRFGHDFGQVRIYNDTLAAEAATAVNASAFTVANNIVFQRGAYAPTTAAGRQLLAHELTHVVQQSNTAAHATVQRQEESPRFPDFPRLATTLSDNIGQNLHDFGHHFYRIATLYPDQPDLLEDAFARYALGKNVLETGFTFAGAEPGTASALALTSGILFKGVNFLRNGELVIDFQFDLGNDLRLETGIDLAVNPDDMTDVRRVNAGVSLVGRF